MPEKDESENKSKVTWLDKVLLKIWPSLEMRRLAKRMKINNIIFDRLHDIFNKTEKIDIFPARGNERGFIIVLERQTALFFYQNGDHFEYDGFEMGKYVRGDVTIFDHLRNRDLSPYPEE